MTWLLLALLAHDPITTKITWDTEISRLINRRCVFCHGAGSSVNLSNYQAARPWAKAIRNQVSNRSMPPWGAVKGYGEFSNDPSLTPLELEMITQWVEGGAPEGEAKYLQKSLVSRTISPAKFIWKPLPATFPRTIVAIRASGPTEVSATLPDGSVQHLLWIHDNQADWKQAYIFREPVTLPSGSKLLVTGAKVEVSEAPRR